MPAESLEQFVDKALGVVGGQAALRLRTLDQSNSRSGEYAAAGEDRLCALPQCWVLNQLQSKQRGEDAKWIARQRLLMRRAKCGRMNRNAGDGQIVVADRIHAHHRERAAHQAKLLRRAETDGAVTLQA